MRFLPQPDRTSEDDGSQSSVKQALPSPSLVGSGEVAVEINVMRVMAQMVCEAVRVGDENKCDGVTLR